MTRGSDQRAAVTACTIVAQNYLPLARVLAESYLRQHPQHHFVIAIVDSYDATGLAGLSNTDQAANCRVVGFSSFGMAANEYLRMATAYSVTELATSVKPQLLRELRRKSSDVVVYLDPDTQVFAAMPEVETLALAHQLVLTPHFLTPLPRDGKKPTESDIMGSGIFNLGFIAVGPGSDAFLDFWATRLRHDAIAAPERQLFTDQRWVDQVPALFHHYVISDPGFNVAYWNLHERTLGHDSTGEITVNGVLLRFFHFSGYRPEKNWLLSQHSADNPRVVLSESPLVRELCDRYAGLLRSAGYAESLAAIPYGFDTFTDGEPLPTSARRVFRTAWIDAERNGHEPPPHAYRDDGGEHLRRWLTEPSCRAEYASGTHRLALSVWRARADLQVAFPAPTATDAVAFREWCDTSGLDDGDIPEWATLGNAPAYDSPTDAFGVNIAGYLTAQLGVGEMGRLVHQAVTGAGIDTVSVIEEEALLNRTDVDHAGSSGRPRFPLSIVAVNADQTSTVLNHYPELGHERYKIGLWAWELEEFPSWLHSAFELVDEIWTVSEFCRRSIAAHSPVPVKTFPATVVDDDPGRDVTSRISGVTQFLFAFDFNSVAERKNPYGLVRAFQGAFDDRQDVRLVIKSINGDQNPREAERLRLLTGNDSRIRLVEHYLAAAELDDIYRSSDCYVSLHRSEGFGLTLAEAMVRGLPVISTDYSSTAEFVDEAVGWPIPHTMTVVGSGNRPYPPEAVWAEPDLDAAADAMRAVAANPEAAAQRGKAARERIRNDRSMSAAATWVDEQLRTAYATWQQRRHDQQTTEPDPLDRLKASKEALQWRPATDAPSRIPLAPALRKAVVRALDHYDVHQRTVLGELVSGIEVTSSRLFSRLERLEERFTASNEHAREMVRDAIAPLRKQQRETSEHLTLLQRQLDGLGARVADVEHASHRVNDLCESVDAASRDRDKLSDRMADLGQQIHEQFHDRDKRSNDSELHVEQLRRELASTQHLLRLRHAPVPEGSDVVLCDAGTLLLPADQVVRRWISYYQTWEPDESRLLAELMNARPGTFLDVGAHVGYHSLRMVQSCPPLHRIVAVEACPDNLAHLRRNVAANLSGEQVDRVHTLGIAAWDHETTVELVRDPANSGDGRVCDVSRPGAPPTDPVPAHRLDQLAEVVTEPVTVIKLDLQGRDHRALAGAAGVLHRDRPDVLCEFDPDAITEAGEDPGTILANYRALGYSVHEISDGTAVPTDDELISNARSSERGDISLWLRPV